MVINSKTRLLVISPHPDDEALGIAGLIGKCIKEKARVLIYYLCVGKSRQLVTGKTEENTRLKEIKNVANFSSAETKVEYVGDEFCRLDTIAQKELIEKIEDVIEDFKPTIAGIPSAGSYNQDHRAVYEASITALRPTPKEIRHFVSFVLEFYEPYLWGVTPPKNPNYYLDLSTRFKNGNLLDFKINFYKKHKTQVRKDPFPRSPQNLIRLAHVYGKEIGVEIAEAYHILRGEIW